MTEVIVRNAEEKEKLLYQDARSVLLYFIEVQTDVYDYQHWRDLLRS